MSHAQALHPHAARARLARPRTAPDRDDVAGDAPLCAAAAREDEQRAEWDELGQLDGEEAAAVAVEGVRAGAWDGHDADLDPDVRLLSLSPDVDVPHFDDVLMLVLGSRSESQVSDEPSTDGLWNPSLSFAIPSPPLSTYTGTGRGDALLDMPFSHAIEVTLEAAKVRSLDSQLDPLLVAIER